MEIYMGNLSVEEIERRTGINFTANEKKELNSFREQNTDHVRNHYCWHCFDIPFVISCGNYSAALRMKEIFERHKKEFITDIQISGDWEGSPEPDDGYKLMQLFNCNLICPL